MAIQISGNTVIDNSRNITGVAVTASSQFDLPDGNVAARPSVPGTGSVRYNTEYGLLEVYTGSSWIQMTAEEMTPNAALVGPGQTSSGLPVSTVDKISNMASTGSDAAQFGSLSGSLQSSASFSNSIRGFWAGGLYPVGPSLIGTNKIEYLNILSSGGTTYFGDLTTAKPYGAGCSNSTRGLTGGGSPSSAIEYVTMATTGNAINFGNLSQSRFELASCSSPTRGIFAGGSAGPTNSNVIDYVTIASTGNAIDFGDLTYVRQNYPGACSNSTRAIIGSNNTSASCDYITIASTGNAIFFGNTLFGYPFSGYSAFSNSTRGFFAGGVMWQPASPIVWSQKIQYFTFSSTGNATEFGNISQGRYLMSGCSSGHGGLQ